MYASLNPSNFVRYTTAILAVIVATMLGHVELFENMRFSLYLFTVVGVAWYAGVGPGLAAAAVSCVLLDYFFLTPVYSLAVDGVKDLLRLVIFAVAVLVVNAAITEARVSEDENDSLWRDLTRARSEADEMDQRFHALVECLPGHAIFSLDVNGRIASWSHGAEQMFGYQLTEIQNKHLSCLYPTELIPHGKPLAGLQDAATRARADDETWLVRKGGSRLHARVVLTALRKRPESDAPLAGFLVLVREIPV